jgi:ABC-2 type transport system ATP-binding protein
VRQACFRWCRDKLVTMDNTAQHRPPVFDRGAVSAGAAVSLRGLYKHYGQIRAVDGVDLVIAPGEVVALLGPNGAGKSTTVDMLLGLTKPDSGEVRIFGQSPHDAVANGAVGAVLQEGSLLEDATVGETIAMIASLHHNPMPVAEALRRANVEDLASRRCTRLSGGQKQRVRFAVALVCNPHLLVLDEPTSAMDVGTRREFWQSMKEFTDAGKTVLFATHYLDEAEEFADRVVLMRAGTVIADGSVAEVRSAVSGRTLTAQVPGATAAVMRTLPGVAEAAVRGERIELDCADSDAAVRALITGYPQAHDIEIKAVGLEEAFLALTSDAQGSVL